MATPPLPEKERARRKAHIEAALIDGFAPKGQFGGKGSSVAEAARRLCLKSGALENFLRTEETNLKKGKPNFYPDWSLFQEEDEPAQINATIDERIRERRLEQEVSELRRREKEILDRLSKAEEYRSSVMGLVETPLDTIHISIGTSGHSRSETAILVISDVHDGALVNGDEMDGLNSYDPDICAARLGGTFQVAGDLLTKHWAGAPPDRVLVALAGDLVDGELRIGSARTTAMRPMESVRHLSGILSAGLDHLLSVVSCPVDVISVVGNHGRAPLSKPEAAGVAVESFDTLAADFLEMNFRNNPRVTFYVPPGPDALVSIYGYRFLITHGDRIGTGGGRGFIGAELPILRGFQKTFQDYALRGIILDHIICGHYHTALSAALGTANGSLVGPNEYSQANRMRPDQPAQAFITVHPDHGITQTRWIKPAIASEGNLYKAPVQGQDIRPRYRVKAVSAA